MEKEQFTVLMTYISADLAAMISEKEQISAEAAIEKLYASDLYTLLEQEDTKLWHYSTPMLYSLFQQEEKGEAIVFPDV